ncbi:K+-sensing histidine kinase KdpD [Streptacidiphilus sp. MAP12-33]|uniref:ATP-binding protein n=1 Tax=Streptacidiphilus sp. MAP12-33 TaxID=3156266 RepID=UPI003513328D
MTPPWGPRRRSYPVRAEPAPAPASPGGCRQRTVTLPAIAASVTLARRTAQTAFTTFGVAPTASLLDAALLITTELVANAVRHATASGHLDLTLGLSGQELTISVLDEDPTLPPWPPGSRYGAARRGLTVVADLVAGHGGRLDLKPDFSVPGKTVRVTLPRTT